MSFLEDLPFYETLLDLINNKLGLAGYLEDGYTFFTGLDVVTQVIALIVVAIVLVIGLFELLKKLSKIIIIVGVLAGLYVLYDSGALSGIIGG